MRSLLQSKLNKVIPKQNRVLPIIVVSQFAGTSLWFTGNAVLPELEQAFHLSKYAVSLVTSAVMSGFVAGTLVFAILALADRYSPVRLFFFSSIAGAVSNAAIAWLVDDAAGLFFFRFLTGFFLAGIYPVGMKIASDWYDKGLGKALGYLLGALILGTAFPHLLKNRDFQLQWEIVLYCTSLFAVSGGVLMMAFVGDGPYRKRSGKFQWNAIATIFHSRKWRQVAFGYFGHMWELYTFWGFLPLIIGLYATRTQQSLNIPLWSFLVIGSGSLSSIIGGYFSQKIGSAKVAFIALFISGLCCFLSPLIYYLPLWLFLLFLFIWGFTVCPDSPQFSALVAQYAPEHLKGTALTIYNSIGFLISSVSLVVIDRFFHSPGLWSGGNAFLLLGLGAFLGIPPILQLLRSNKPGKDILSSNGR